VRKLLKTPQRSDQTNLEIGSEKSRRSKNCGILHDIVGLGEVFTWHILAGTFRTTLQSQGLSSEFHARQKGVCTRWDTNAYRNEKCIFGK